MTPYGLSYFCDDIRFEQQNKFSLIGCYGPDMILQQQPLPVLLPKLGILIQVRFPLERRAAGKILIYAPGADPMPLIEWPEEENYVRDDARKKETEQDQDLTPQRVALFPCVLSPFVIQKDGHLKIRMIYGSETIRLGALRVVLQDQSSVATPPTSTAA
jgi:hypothetical protein